MWMESLSEQEWLFRWDLLRPYVSIFENRTEHKIAFEHLITAGTYAALGLDLQRVSQTAMEAQQAKLGVTKSKLGIEDVLVDDVIGQILHLHAQTYFARISFSDRLIAHQYNVGTVKRPTELLATFAPTFTFVLGDPVEVAKTGMTVDVARSVVSAVSRVGDLDRERAYILSLGQHGSGAEHETLEALNGVEAVSSVKLLTEANNRQIPIFRVDASNVNTVIPQLTVSSDVITDIQNAVAAGKQVLIPRDNITLLDWSGAGYIVLDPETGAGAYLISGGLAGGATATDTDAKVLETSILVSDIATFVADGFESAAHSGVVATKGVAKFAGPIGIMFDVITALLTFCYVYEKTNSLMMATKAFLLDAWISVILLVMFHILGPGLFFPGGGILLGIIMIALVAAITIAAKHYYISQITGDHSFLDNRLRLLAEKIYAKLTLPDVLFEGLSLPSNFRLA